MSNEDDKDWNEYLKLVKPIKKVQLTNPIEESIKSYLSKEKDKDKEEEREIFLKEPLINQENIIELGNENGIDKNLIRKIKKGTIKIEGELDLHGQTLEESKRLSTDFIRINFKYQRRLLLIITGKGKRLGIEEGWKGIGVLKESLPKWISTSNISKFIIWFDKAPANKGGDGAMLVYLKKIKE